MAKSILTILGVFISAFLRSQTGPAGVESSTDNVLWLKADKGTFSNAGTTASTAGGAVQQWNDQSGNNKHAIQLTAGLKPTWQTNIFNGLPAIRFDGNDDGILSAALTTSSTVTFFAVVRVSALSKTNPGILQGSPTGLGYSVNPPDKSIGMWVNTATQRIWGRGIQTSTAQRNITQVTALATNTAYITCNRYDGANINQYVNNTISGTITYDGTLRSWTDVAIGTQGTETWNGDIAEIIVYKKSLNDAQRHIVDNYLSAKYNIALASNNKYDGDNFSNGDYDRDVAGLGKETSGSTTSFSANVSGGLTITANSGLDNGDYIMAGHASATNSPNKTDVGGMTGTNNARWNRVWFLDVTNTSTVINTNIEFDNSDGNITGLPLGVASNYVLLYRAAQTGSWTELTSTVTVSGDRVLFSNVDLTTDGYYTIGTKDYMASPLPIELLSFDAIMNGKQVDINWTTATELNNDYYTIEKSKDGINFETSSIVDAAGNSLSLIN